MRIFYDEPNDWRDLQNKVARIFKEMNCEVGIEKDIETVRGIVNIDVYAEDRSTFPSIIFLCECKYWSNPIPKTVIHSFRTVMSDYGANCGYIISKAGFQSGSYEANKNSNILLLTWNEFLELVEERWLSSMIEKLDEVGRPLRDYSDYLSINFYEKAKERGIECVEEFETLCCIYRCKSLYSSSLLYFDLSKKVNKENIEQQINFIKRNFEELHNINSFSEYFNFLIEYCKNGVGIFDDLFGEPLRKYENV